MKNLEINSIDCVEMNNLEMEEIQGGMFWGIKALIVAVGTLIYDLLDK